MSMSKKTKIDMSSEAITARLKRACGLGDAERAMTFILSAIAPLKAAKPDAEKSKTKKKNSRSV
jgi:hypothetical protein